MNEIWIGLVKVKNKKGCTTLGHAKGAYTNALAFCKNKEEYLHFISIGLSEYDLYPVKSDDIEKFDDRIKRTDVDEEIYKLCKELNKSTKVRFSTFHSFLQED